VSFAHWPSKFNVSHWRLKSAELKEYIPAKLFSKRKNNSNHPLFDFSLRMFLYVFVLFGIYLGSLLVLMASNKSGISNAEKFIERTKEGLVIMK